MRIRPILLVWAIGVIGGMALQGRSAAQDENPNRPPSRAGLPPGQVDVHSWGNPHQIRVRHVSLRLRVDFESRTISGTATLDLDRSPECPPEADLWLDTRGLAIRSVVAPRPGGEPVSLPFRLEVPQVPEEERLLFPSGARSDGSPIHGTPLVIESIGQAEGRVAIAFETSPDASALQWLTPAQTAGGRSPFLFSQSQAIHARSWIPLQDSPGVRVTYDAIVEVAGPGVAGLKAVMSADGNFGTSRADGRRAPEPEPGRFSFSMERPIPPYLIALAVGDLEFRPLGDRAGVYAEPALIEAAAFEFADTPAMIATTEERFGPYRWGRYDLLVLPPSFPFGGMENPMLTFATPTILAGDRSLVSLVAHELAHSWSGNLVTNATWDDFWLNEGFTSYLERRIIEDVFGADRAEMEQVLALDGLRDELSELDERDQVLHIDLWGRDPDENVTSVPYDKGALFLRELERAFGRDRFDDFLRGYFDRFAFQSITTGQFERHLVDHLFEAEPEAARRIDLRSWLDAPGLPPIDEPTSGRLAAVDRQAKAWLAGDLEARELDTKDWSTQEWLHFLGAMPADLPASRVGELDRALMLTQRGNAEIACAWLELTIRAGYGEADARLDRFLTTIGRRKFLMPLYKAMVDAGQLDRARTIYAMARPKYHPIAVESLDLLLGDPGDR
ncbi:M1 family peptidase [Tautonia sociabilis]|uniref:Aminopeptidase N n=2 Tax=Tautonia sociabilis TaxID=2080755 RepID=A0A432MCB0_9BACT|nr:M1 family peptidase [Tautonia sociabilis]